MFHSCSRRTLSSAATILARRSTTPAVQRKLSTVTLNDDALVIPSLNNATFPYIWLRDSCHSPECKHPETTQKLHSSTDFDVDIRPRTVKIVRDAHQVQGNGLHIEWPDGHASFFSRSFLERHSSSVELLSFRKDVEAETWAKEDLQKSKNLFLPYHELQAPAGLLKGIDQLCRHGLLFVRDVPVEPEVGVSNLALLFSSEIRETFYGRIFHVRKTDSDNIAFTNLKLDLHADLCYFDHPPRYQLLHCLRNRVQGGTSVFSDSFHAAKTLRSFYPDDYDILTRTPVPFEYLFGDHHLHATHVTIETDPHNPVLGSPPIKFVNYSPPFQAPLLLASPSSVNVPQGSALRRFYLALGRFANLINNPEHTYGYTLQEGDAVIFDNRRVLHSRTAFTDLDPSRTEHEFSRWLQGCYIEGDSMKDRGRVLRSKRRAGLI
ncbi:hypothetical protein D9757_004204 [Collybiopsis confluens]|uniref:Gamma-butyrobetaine dioxygenase n=1 Tax=Collybiopsis confluens TaxID=2823264 RepID=A0A8H5HU90_9AGAR|nr:hypothetical protein D9757_004204 [Collybiopsis confluens]